MKIILNENDLQGSYLYGTDCPIARCLKRMGYKNVRVGGWTVEIGHKKYQLANNGDDAVVDIFWAKNRGLKSVEVVIEGLEPPTIGLWGRIVRSLKSFVKR